MLQPSVGHVPTQVSHRVCLLIACQQHVKRIKDGTVEGGTEDAKQTKRNTCTSCSEISLSLVSVIANGSLSSTALVWQWPAMQTMYTLGFERVVAV